VSAEQNIGGNGPCVSRDCVLVNLLAYGEIRAQKRAFATICFLNREDEKTRRTSFGLADKRAARAGWLAGQQAAVDDRGFGGAAGDAEDAAVPAHQTGLDGALSLRSKFQRAGVDGVGARDLAAQAERIAKEGHVFEDIGMKGAEFRDLFDKLSLQ
jgi:hypothetical protein